MNQNQHCHVTPLHLPPLFTWMANSVAFCWQISLIPSSKWRQKKQRAAAAASQLPWPMFFQKDFLMTQRWMQRWCFENYFCNCILQWTDFFWFFKKLLFFYFLFYTFADILLIALTLCVNHWDTCCCQIMSYNAVMLLANGWNFILKRINTYLNIFIF